MATFRPLFCGVLAFVVGEFGIFPPSNRLASAAEPLQISGQTNKLSVPGGASTGSTLNRSLDFFKRDSSAPASADDAPTISPSQERVGRNRKLQELIDRQNNWIFLTPETFNNGPNPADMFDKEESSAGHSETSSKVIENYWKEQDRQSSPASSSSTRPRRSRDEKDSPEKDSPALSEASSSPLSSTSSEKSGKLNWDGLFNQKGPANPALQPSQDIFNSLFNRPMESSTALNVNPNSPGVTSPSNYQPDDFTKLLKGHPSSPLSRGYDPINALVDSTSAEINPVTAKTVEEYSNAKYQGLDRLPGNLSSLGRSPLNFFDDPNAKMLEQSSSRPAFTQPLSSRYAQPQPAVLEFPRRKF